MSLRPGLRRAAPYLVAAGLLTAGYLNLIRGLDHPGVPYRPWAFEHHSYSDILAMSGDRYLGGGRPVPYLEDRIEYPVLLGLLLWVPSALPGGQAAHFTASYLFLAACLFAAIAMLRRLPGANAWWLAATPAIAYYAGLNWDLFPIALLVASVLAFERGRWAGAGALGALGISAKLFPVVLLPPAIAAALRGRRWRSLLAGGAALAGVLLTVNVPFAWAAFDGWSWFARYNAGRGPENSIWQAIQELFAPRLTGTAVDGITLALLALAAAFAAWAVCRLPPEPGAQARAVRLGAALILVVWIASNKIWSPQYALYGFVAAALVSPPLWLFWPMAAAAVFDYHVAFEYRARGYDPGFRHAFFFTDALLRTCIYGALGCWMGRALWRQSKMGGAKA
jgi:hypothetical protein